MMLLFLLAYSLVHLLNLFGILLQQCWAFVLECWCKTTIFWCELLWRDEDILHLSTKLEECNLYKATEYPIIQYMGWRGASVSWSVRPRVHRNEQPRGPLQFKWDQSFSIITDETFGNGNNIILPIQMNANRPLFHSLSCHQIYVSSHPICKIMNKNFKQCIFICKQCIFMCEWGNVWYSGLVVDKSYTLNQSTDQMFRNDTTYFL